MTSLIERLRADAAFHAECGKPLMASRTLEAATALGQAHELLNRAAIGDAFSRSWQQSYDAWVRLIGGEQSKEQSHD